MRVISGELRGRRLTAPEGLNTRPTSEKVKEAVFSIIQFDIEGRRALDLFAGSGQMGIEALSRGADECVFVDSDKAAMRTIISNLEHCGIASRAKTLLSDYASALRRERQPFDLIFIDPPYAAGLVEKVLNSISMFDMLDFNGIIVVETDSKQELPDEVSGITKGREYRYGRTKITLYHRGE